MTAGPLTVRAFDANDPAQAQLFQRYGQIHVECEQGYWGDDATPYALGELRSDPGDRVRRYLQFAAELDGRLVGMGLVVQRLTDNLDLAPVQISVLPGHWHRGYEGEIARRMAEHTRPLGIHRFKHSVEVPVALRDTLLAENLAAGWELLWEGFRLDLPLDEARRARAHREARLPVADGYEVVLTRGVPPDPQLDAQQELREGMFRDDPRGGLAVEPRKVDIERVRRYYELYIAAGRRYWTAMARYLSSGEWVGFSDLTTTASTSAYARQEETYVLPAHRGRGLGLAMKRATLAAILTDLPGLPGVRTWTAANNPPMLATNRALGCVPRGTDLNFLLTF